MLDSLSISWSSAYLNILSVGSDTLNHTKAKMPTATTTVLDIIDGTQMCARIVAPMGKITKGIIVLQEAFGVNEYIERIEKHFADQGYLAIAPELYHRTAVPGFTNSYTDYAGIKKHIEALTDDGETVDMQSCFDWLVQKGVSCECIATIGFCMGGRASFLANATLPVAAAVSFYGGGIAQTLLSRTNELHAPQLFCWGGADAHILPEHIRAVADALRRANKPYVEAVFSDAPHGFACDAREAYQERSAREAWALTDAFLKQYLR